MDYHSYLNQIIAFLNCTPRYIGVLDAGKMEKIAAKSHCPYIQVESY